MIRWFSRLSLLWKILLSTSFALSLLFAIMGEIVLGSINATMSAGLNDEVRASFKAYTSLWDSRAKLLMSVSSILSDMPQVRSAFSTQDKATIRDSLGDLWKKVSDASAIFVVTDPRGRVIGSLGGDSPLALETNMEVVRTAAPCFPDQAKGFFVQNGDLYQMSVTPVYVDSTPGQQQLLNVLVAGIHVNALVAQEAKEATGSEFLFLPSRPGAPAIVSTLNDRATRSVIANLAKAGSDQLVSDGISEYASFRTPLRDVNGARVGDLCILRCFDSARQRLSWLYTKIVLLWVVAMAGGLALTFWLARRIVEPIKQLDRAAAEVARQNYAIEVDVRSEDEMGRLARTFNNMCASIRQAREDLIRHERISTIGRLSGSIVHDLRNPLAAIYGGAEMLVDGDMPPAHVKRLAGNIYRASRRIQELLQDLLNVSRGKGRPPEVCRLREVASAACDSLAAAAEAQNVVISLAIPPDIELPLERNRMERAFVNVIGNSLEAMPEGGQVVISATLEDASVLIRVEDNGPGIAPEIRSKLFQPFVTAGKRNGLGLGLALTRQTVLEHGGDMWVDSQPGRGARFSIRLPGAGKGVNERAAAS